MSSASSWSPPSMFACCCTAEEQGTAVTVLDAGGAAVASERSSVNLVRAEPAIYDELHPARGAVMDGSATMDEEFRGLIVPSSSNRRMVEEEDTLVQNERERGSSSFSVKLTRAFTDTSWGLMVELVDEKTLYICDLVAGSDNPVQVYNATAEADREVKAGDYIVRVNHVCGTWPEGLSSSSSLLSELLYDELTSATAVELMVRRPFSFDTRMSKGSGKLALEVNFSDKGNALVIARVSVKQCIPEILVGDRILCVGGVRGSPNQMLRALQESTAPLRLRISRPMPT